MKLSIAMCTFNGARYLREQLESIGSQTRPPDELVVCDDSSTDETSEIAQSFARTSNFPVRIRVNEARLGSTRNFAQALHLCEGDVIAFSDQDDVWLPDKLEQVEQRLSRGAALAFTNGEIVGDSLQSLDESLWQAARFGKREQSLFASGRAFEVLVDHNVVTGAAMAFRAEFKPLIEPIPEGLVHDGVPVLHDWWAAILISAVSELSFIDQQLFKYRQHAQQQLGVRPFAEGSRDVLASRVDSIRKEIAYLSAILERLSDRPQFEKRAGVLDRLRAHIEHFESRATMPRQGLRRASVIANELLAGRYHRYSNGLFSAAKDMLIRG